MYSGYFALKIDEKFINKNRHLAESFGSTKECRVDPARPARHGQYTREMWQDTHLIVVNIFCIISKQMFTGDKNN